MSSSTTCGAKSRRRAVHLSSIPSAVLAIACARRATSPLLERSPRHAAKHSLAVDALEYARPERGLARLRSPSLRLAGAGALSTNRPIAVVGASGVGTGPTNADPAR